MLLETGLTNVQNSTCTKSVADSSDLIPTVFAGPIIVRCTFCTQSPGLDKDIFTFPFARDQHTTVKKLFDVVTTSYWHKRVKHVVDPQHRRMMLHLSKKGGLELGGPVFDNADPD